jgi:hypothetical protein
MTARAVRYDGIPALALSESIGQGGAGALEAQRRAALPNRDQNGSGLQVSDESRLPASVPPEGTGQLVLYRTDDGRTRIQVRLIQESVWLALNQIADLFQRDKSVISKHIKNIFESREIDPARTVAKIATVQTEGGRSVTREIEFYRLEVILAVGYRVKSARGTQFRQWATAQLEQYLVKGFAMDDERLKQAGGGNYFDELLARIRDIRSSERSLPRFRGTPGAQPQAHDDARMDRQAGQFPEAERPRTADTRRDHLPRRCAGQGGIRVRQVPGNRKRQAAARRYGFR